MSDPKPPTAGTPGNFIRDLIDGDRAAGKHGGRVATRFPPEPNGYLHIGHAKSICLNFGLARDYAGTCNLRFDDTNPTTEEVEYVESIQNDVRWVLGAEGRDPWNALYYASDYFEQLYQFAEKLVEKGAAYVDSHSEDEIRDYRGDYYKKGRPCSCRQRPVAENLALLRRMRAGELQEGSHVLRGKIDLTSQNMNLRDPVLYRIRFAPHHRTGTKWCIYPMYDYAHPLSDAIERITHSICTLEFESHRPLYDWCIAETGAFPSRQIEFARLNLTYTVMSKRKLLELVQKKLVDGWDDPRMPTLAGLRRRGYTSEAIRAFCDRIGVSKADSLVDVGLLEYAIREDLNRRSPRVMGVLRPLKLTIENFPDGQVRELEAPLHPEDASQGSRKLPFTRTLYIERDDYRDDPPKDWFRLAPGREVRLRYAGLVTCKEVVRDDKGEPIELRCTMDLASWGGNAPDGRTVRGTLHWVSAAHAIDAEVRLYDRLFSVENPGTTEGRSFVEEMNPDSLVRVGGAKLEPHLATLGPGARVQFERLGYFCADRDSQPGKPVWNRTVTLKDTWAKLEAKVSKKMSSDKEKDDVHTRTTKFGMKAPFAEKEQNAPQRERSKTIQIPTMADEMAKIAVSTPPGIDPIGPEITIDDFARLDLRVGIVRAATTVEEAKKLLRLEVDLGEGRNRQIFAGLRAYYPDPAVLVGQRVIVVANLKPRQMKFGLSEGMVLAAGGGDLPHHVLTASPTALPGDKVA